MNFYYFSRDNNNWHILYRDEKGRVYQSKNQVLTSAQNAKDVCDFGNAELKAPILEPFLKNYWTLLGEIEKVSFALHAEMWYQEQGKIVPEYATVEWDKMYQEWVEFAFPDFRN